MKSTIIFRILFLASGLLLINSLRAQDTIYVMRNGMAIYRCAVTDVDSISYENSTLNRSNSTEAILTNPLNSIFNQALATTGLIDSIAHDRDKTYYSSNYQSLISSPLSAGLWYYQMLPPLRRYGYTVLMESDSVFRANGINNLNELKTYAASVYNRMYPQDASVNNPQDQRNSLNRFVAYHILNVKLKTSGFIDDYIMYNGSFSQSHMLDIPGQNFHEYYATLCPNTLIEITRKGGTQETNLINYNSSSNSAIHIIKNYPGSETMNTCLYNIDRLLVFDDGLVQQLSSKKLRFDFASFFPELMNNDLRGHGSTKPHLQYIFPKHYLSNLYTNDSIHVSYLTPYEKILDYEGDEIMIISPNSAFSLSFKSLPVPAGTYEVRIGSGVYSDNLLFTIGIDSLVSEVFNFCTSTTSDAIGYETPGTIADDSEGYVNDMIMRSHGYMKEPAIFRVPVNGWVPGKNARYSYNHFRKIIGTYTFDKFQSHTIQINSNQSSYLYLDYIEFIPVSLIDTEDIY